MTTLDDVRADHNVVAVFRDVDDARAAILALEQAGLRPDAISLLGAWPGEDEVPRIVLHRSAIGLGVGLGVGGVIAAAAALTAPAATPVTWWAAALAGGLVGALLGGLLAAYMGAGSSPAWIDTFAADDRGNVVVGVHSDDRAEVRRGMQVLRSHDPLAVNRFRGRRRVRSH